MPVFTIETPGGQKLDIEAADETAALQGAQDWYRENGNPDKSYSGALRHGAASAASGIGKTLGQFGFPNAQAALDKGAAAIAPKNYQPTDLSKPDAGDTTITPSDLLKEDAVTERLDKSSVFGGTPNRAIRAAGRYLFPGTYSVNQMPRAIAEGAAPLASDVAAATAAGPLGALASYTARNAGRNIEERAANNERDPTLADKVVGTGTAALGGAMNLLPVGRIVNPTRSAATGLVEGVGSAAARLPGTATLQGGTNYAQDILEQAGNSIGTEKGLKVDPERATAAGFTGALTGGAVSGLKGVVKDIPSAVRFRDLAGNEEGARGFANRMVERTDSADPTGPVGDLMGRSALTKLQSPNTAGRSVLEARADVRRELIAARQGVPMSPEAANAVSRVQRGMRLTEDDIQHVDAAGSPALTQLAREASAANSLVRQGQLKPERETFGGGLAAKARNFAVSRPWVAAGTGLGLTGGAGHLLAGTTGAMLGPPAAIIAGYLALKSLGKMRGTYSPAATFAEKFAGAPALPGAAPVPPQPGPPAPMPPNGPPQPWGPIPPGRPTGPTMPGPARSPAPGPWGPPPPGPTVPQMPLGPQPRTPMPMPPAVSRMQALAQRLSDENPGPQGPRPNRTIDTGIAQIVQKLAATQQQQPPAPAPTQAATARTVASAVRPERVQSERPWWETAAASSKLALNAMAKAQAGGPPPKLRKKESRAQSDNGTTQSRSQPDEAVADMPVHEGLKFVQPNHLDRAIADKALGELGPRPDPVRGRYHASTMNRQARIRDRLHEMSADARFPSDNMQVMEMVDRIRTEVRSRSDLSRFLEDDVAPAVGPSLAALIRAYLSPKWAQTVWKKQQN